MAATVCLLSWEQRLQPYRKASAVCWVCRWLNQGKSVNIFPRFRMQGCRKKGSLPEETVTRVPWPQKSKTLHRDMVPTVARTKTWPPIWTDTDHLETQIQSEKVGVNRDLTWGDGDRGPLTPEIKVPVTQPVLCLCSCTKTSTTAWLGIPVPRWVTYLRRRWPGSPDPRHRSQHRHSKVTLHLGPQKPQPKVSWSPQGAPNLRNLADWRNLHFSSAEWGMLVGQYLLG